MADIDYALSIKQPWAALLLHGLKTIEIRRWPTARRGRILIHSARVPAADPAAWALVPEALREEARLVGGILGACDLTGCIAYHSSATFAADQPHHLNPPAWFQPPVLYGFTLTNVIRLPFRPYPGWFRFFPVTDETPQRGQGKRARPQAKG